MGTFMIDFQQPHPRPSQEPWGMTGSGRKSTYKAVKPDIPGGRLPPTRSGSSGIWLVCQERTYDGR